MRGGDQHGLARPDIEPDAGLAPAWEAKRLNAGFVRPSEFQIAIVGRDLNRQPFATSWTQSRVILLGIAHATQVLSGGTTRNLIQRKPIAP